MTFGVGAVRHIHSIYRMYVVHCINSTAPFHKLTLEMEMITLQCGSFGDFSAKLKSSRKEMMMVNTIIDSFLCVVGAARGDRVVYIFWSALRGKKY